MTTFLVGWDNSSCAERALAFTASLARRMGGEIVVWQAIPPPQNRLQTLTVGYGLDLDEEVQTALAHWLDEKRRQAEQAIVERIRPLLQQGLTIRTEVYTGDQLEGFLEAIQRYRVDWIVMGRGTDEHRVGSFAMKILRTTRQPVVIVPETYDVREIHNIVVPVDFTIAKSQAMQIALELAELTGATLHVLHIMEIYLYEGPAQVMQKIEQILQQTLDQWTVAHTTPPHVPIEKSLRRATDAATGILRYVREIHADLIVMDSHARGPLMHLLLGSVAEKILQRAPVPVVVTKPNV